MYANVDSVALLECGQATSPGRRAYNEDYAVADGVGGEQAGEIASRLACATVRKCIVSGATLSEALISANTAIIELSQRKGLRRMASTMAIVLTRGHQFEIAWVGDTRVYLCDGELNLLTKDHSYVQHLVDAERISFAEASTHPDRGRITQALGAQPELLRIGHNRGTLQQNSCLMICSDGVSDQVSPGSILSCLNQTDSAQAAADRLVQLSEVSGGTDNATCIVLRSASAPPQPHDPATVYQRFDGEQWHTGGLEEHVIVTQVAVGTDEREPVTHEDRSDTTTKRRRSTLLACLAFAAGIGLLIGIAYLT